ncbi:kinase-like protein [Xylaria acuta]|nr:kinase-like protein [Xylaria acuta]
MWWSIIGLGGSCFVTSTDKKTALKGYQVWEDGKLRAMCGHECEEVLAREALVYKHLGEHPHILRCYGLEGVHPSGGINSLRLEYSPLGEVRSFIEKNRPRPPSKGIRLQMALDVATGMSHVHKMGVQHCDMTCRNLFLFDNFRVKIGDFGGSLIQGHDELKPIVYEASAYELPRRGREFEKRPARERELFALGSAIYEIMAWGQPFEGLADDDIEKNYAAEVFPNLEGVTANHIIRKCWDEQYTSADEIVESLEALIVLEAEANVGGRTNTGTLV